MFDFFGQPGLLLIKFGAEILLAVQNLISI